jgi:hypothetical protein
MKLAATALSALLSLPLMANADTYTTFTVSGTDSQEQSITGLGDPGCNRIACNNYAPGTFSGVATVDISKDTIVAATITTCCADPSSPWVLTLNTNQTTPNVGSGLNLEIYSAPFPDMPYLSLDFNLSRDTVSGFVSGFTGGSGDSGASADYTMDMVGKVTPKSTTPPTPAPEIDSASAASTLTLLVGGLAMMRGRKHKGATA